MQLTFIGELNGIDNYNKIRILVDDPTIITSKINDVRNPYRVLECNKLECLISPVKYKDYFLFVAEKFKYKKVTVTVTTKRYCFDGKKGTSLLLKYLDIIDI